jgi:putative nucleotidyltransferase with HDIG domain
VESMRTQEVPCFMAESNSASPGVGLDRNRRGLRFDALLRGADAKDAQYFPIPLASLRLDAVADFDLYLKHANIPVPVLYRERGLSFTVEVRDRLLEHGIDHLYVEHGQRGHYRKYVERHIGPILADPDLDSATKSEVLYLSATGLVQDVLAEPHAPDVVPRSRAFVQDTCEYLMTDRRALACLLRISSFDYYTYTHSVNVFVFSMSLAQRLGHAEPNLLHRYGHGVLLHDIGKSLIDPSVLNCRGKLNAEQWSQMKKHPELGEAILREHGVTDELILDVVRHHHEKLGGGGYPDGLKGDAISPFVRICTVADIFDALTTERPYKAAMHSFPALKLMQDEMLKDLDYIFFRTFVEMMGNPEGN